MSQLVTQFGYWALFAGTFFEGETLLAMGGFAAERGYLRLPLVLAVGFAGTILGDNFYFLLGRYWGAPILARMTSWQRRAQRVAGLLRRYDTAFIVGFRFLYGLRTVSPFIIGMSGVSVPRFVVLNLVSAAVWTAAVGGLGYVFGEAVALVLRDFVHYEVYGFTAIGVLGASTWIVVLWRRRPRR